MNEYLRRDGMLVKALRVKNRVAGISSRLGEQNPRKMPGWLRQELTAIWIDANQVAAEMIRHRDEKIEEAPRG